MTKTVTYDEDKWKLVPVEPTPAMLSALYVTPDFVGQHIVRHSVDKLPDAYQAMLAAAPDHIGDATEMVAMVQRNTLIRNAALEEAAQEAEKKVFQDWTASEHAEAIRALKSGAASAKEA